MKKLIMFKGLPGSGKDIKAKEMMEKNPGGYKRVNKDDLREMIDGSNWSGNNEKLILKIRDFIIAESLKEGKHVLCTDTNLHPKHEIKLREIAKEYGAEFQIIDLTKEVTLEECIERDLKRSRSVGERVIRSMYNQYLKTQEVYPYDNSLPDCIICDLDGTLAKFGNKNPYDRNFLDDKVDEIIKPILGVLKENFVDLHIIILSGRSDKFKEVTKEWLYLNDVTYDQLHMRKEGDMRKDVIVKEELFNEYIRGKYNPLVIFDDRNQVVELWRKMGLKVFQVADGNF